MLNFENIYCIFKVYSILNLNIFKAIIIIFNDMRYDEQNAGIDLKLNINV